MDSLDDAGISHFIPSVQLTGTRKEKLRKLDTLIQHLQQVRAVLSRSGSAEASFVERYRWALRPWQAFTAGLFAGATFALLTGAAIRWLL